MSLKSPSVTSNESDGYSSEVFDENTQDGFSTAEFSSSQSSSSLASSPKATIFVDKVDCNIMVVDLCKGCFYMLEFMIGECVECSVA